MRVGGVGGGVGGAAAGDGAAAEIGYGAEPFHDGSGGGGGEPGLAVDCSAVAVQKLPEGAAM